VSDFYRRFEGANAPRDFDGVEVWAPEFSGDIDIVIDSSGRWLHEGAEIKRASLIELFAKLLRKESDGHYYLVTPVEKWRVQVQQHALQVESVRRDALPQGYRIDARANDGKTYPLSAAYPLEFEAGLDGAFVHLERGLTAKLSRNAWYHLCEWVEQEEGRVTLTSETVVFAYCV
jgi:hypothetical protein